jgi:hypothetical protein
MKKQKQTTSINKEEKGVKSLLDSCKQAFPFAWLWVVSELNNSVGFMIAILFSIS